MKSRSTFPSNEIAYLQSIGTFERCGDPNDKTALRRRRWSRHLGFRQRRGPMRRLLRADREKIVASLRGHDLILVLGAPVFTYHVEGVGPHIPGGASLFQLVSNHRMPSRHNW